MAITVMNAAGEIEEAMTGKAPERPELTQERGPDGRFVAIEPASEAKPPEKSENDAPEWVKRLGITKEQHDGVTEVIRRAVNKKHGQAKEAEEFAKTQYAERQLAEQRAEALEREVQRLKTLAEAAKPATEAVEPRAENFKTAAEYENALIDWKVDQRFKTREAEAAKKAQEARQAEIIKAAQVRVAKAKELVPDFREVTEATSVVIPTHIAEYMQESDLFAELGYHFAKNPADLERIAAMPTRTYSDVQRIGVALSKIESKLKPFAAESHSETQAKVDDGDEPSPSNGVEPSDDTGSAPSQPRVAAPVIQPLNVGSAAQVEKPANKRSYQEDRAAYEKKHRRDFSQRARH